MMMMMMMMMKFGDELKRGVALERNIFTRHE
jgi:hypothetical protein